MKKYMVSKTIMSATVKNYTPDMVFLQAFGEEHALDSGEQLIFSAFDTDGFTLSIEAGFHEVVMDGVLQDGSTVTTLDIDADTDIIVRQPR